MLNPTAVTALLIFASVFVLVQLWGTPLRDVMNTITILTIYGLLVLSYLLRIALIFIGVFALYRVLWAHVNGLDLEQLEV